MYTVFFFHLSPVALLPKRRVVCALSPQQDGLYRRVAGEVHLPSVSREITGRVKGEPKFCHRSKTFSAAHHRRNISDPRDACISTFMEFICLFNRYESLSPIDNTLRRGCRPAMESSFHLGSEMLPKRSPNSRESRWK